MKRLIVLSFIFFLGCNLFQPREDEECLIVKFSNFTKTYEDLNAAKADITISISNPSAFKVYLNAVDLYLIFDDITLTRIATNIKKDKGCIKANSRKNFKFKVSFRNTDNISNLTWRNKQSKLLITGIVYYKFSKYPSYTSKCIVSTYRVR